MSARQIITENEERLSQAQLKSDIDELAQLLDDALVFMGLDGSVVSKQDDLNLHRLPDFRIARMEVVERDIVCFDGLAVVNVLMNASAVFGEETQSGKIRYMRVWHQFADGWRVVSGCMRTIGESAAA